MEAANKSRTEGIIVMLAIVSNPLEVGGVKPTPKIGRESPTQNAGIVARKATKKARAGKRRPIRINLD